jgi:hypothetical protein
MDSDRIDRLAKTLSTNGTRRTLLHRLAALPLGVALPSVLGAVLETAAADDDHGSSHRRQRRKAQHRHQTGDAKENRKGQRKKQARKKGKAKQTSPQSPACTPESRAQTCAGTCAMMANNCGTVIDCGPCHCSPACPAGQVCQSGGRCACDALPPRTVTVTFSPHNDPNLNPDFCLVNIHLRGFASNAPYTVDVTWAFADGSEATVPQHVTTDGCGRADFTPFMFGKGDAARAEVDTVSSGLVPVACSA